MNEELVLEAREVDWGHDVTLIRGDLLMATEYRVISDELRRPREDAR
jgi:hypothetical protein